MKFKSIVIVSIIIILILSRFWFFNNDEYSNREKIIDDFITDLMIYPLSSQHEASSREDIFADYFLSNDNIFFKRKYYRFHYDNSDRRPESFTSDLINYDVNYQTYDDIIVAHVTIDYIVNYIDNVAVEDNCYAIISLEQANGRYYIKNIEIRR